MIVKCSCHIRLYVGTLNCDCSKYINNNPNLNFIVWPKMEVFLAELQLSIKVITKELSRHKLDTNQLIFKFIIISAII